MALDAVAEARTAFNLKALRRHDPSIVQIIETASFVVLYNYNGEWTKTGVEGPMFLIRRDVPPYNGFFILNRNGVENFSADVAQEDDLEITPEFVIYRPESKGDNEIYGIWVFEASQRDVMGQKLLDLQQMLDPPAVQLLPVVPDASVPKQTSANGKSSAKSKKAAKTQAVSNKEPDTERPAAPTVGGELSTGSTQAAQISLDDLFGGPVAPSQQKRDPVPQSGSPPPEMSHPNEVNIAEAESPSASLLDSLFQKAASIVPFTGDRADKEPTKQSLPSSPASTPHANVLLSLLGVQSKPEPLSTADSADAEPSAEAPASAEASKSAPRMSELVEETVKDRIGLGDDGQPLTRREFVTELLSMIHTDPDFVTDLYKSYTTRMS